MFQMPLLFDTKVLFNRMNQNNNIENDDDTHLGGGIYMDRNSEPILTNVTIRDNLADWGVGIFCQDQSNPILNNCSIIGNRGRWGAGIFIRNRCNPILTDVIIQGNFGTGWGAGIVCWENSNLILNNVIVSENTLLGRYGRGGGISCYGYSRIEMTDVTLSSNRASFGGGVWLAHGSDVLITNSDILGNMAANGCGGGLYADSLGDPSRYVLNQVNICDNTTILGGGIFIKSSEMVNVLEMTNVTIANNTAADIGGGLYFYRGARVIITNGIIWDNTPQQVFTPRLANLNFLSIAYSNLEGGEDGIEDNHNLELVWGDNIDADPLFVNPDEGDYHLTEDSPCIDAGNPEHEPDPDGTRADMGAFYFHQENPDPDIYIIPERINFGLIGVGQRLDDTLLVRNYGGEILHVQVPVFDPEDAPVFVVSPEGEFEVEPQSEISLIIRYEPEEEGEVDAVMRLQSDDPDEEIVEIPISGRALWVAPDIEVEPEIVEFGEIAVGIEARANIRVTNAGNFPLVFSSIEIEPENPAFDLIDERESDSLSVNEEMNLSIVFSPDQTGDYEATLLIESNDPDEEFFELLMFGRAFRMAPDINATPDTVIFESSGVGNIINALILIENVGRTTLEISDQYVEPLNTPFSISEGDGAVTLRPDQHHRTILSFNTGEYGDFAASYFIESNDPEDELMEISLIGRALGVDDNWDYHPEEFRILRMYPNPFNATTKITYSAPVSDKVVMKVFTLYGREVETILDGISTPGTHTKTWNAEDASPGLYFVRLTDGTKTDTRKVVLVK